VLVHFEYDDLCCWERGRPVRTEREARNSLSSKDVPAVAMRTRRPRSQHLRISFEIEPVPKFDNHRALCV